MCNNNYKIPVLQPNDIPWAHVPTSALGQVRLQAEIPYDQHMDKCPVCGAMILAQFKTCDKCSKRLDEIRRHHDLI